MLRLKLLGVERGALAVLPRHDHRAINGTVLAVLQDHRDLTLQLFLQLFGLTLLFTSQRQPF